MIRLLARLYAAIAIDLLIGEVDEEYHPVVMMGRAAERLEGSVRPRLPGAAGGAVLTITIGGLSAGAFLLLSRAARLLPRPLPFLIEAGLVSTLFSVRSMIEHAGEIADLLDIGELEDARLSLSAIVSRDTSGLDEGGISRAAIESVAESFNDAVAAPLFFHAIGGPPAAALYRAVNTLDSTFGYLNERNRLFGLVPARTDDLLNYLPARIAAPTIALLSPRPSSAMRTALSASRSHPSPNAGLAEGAFAGALGVELGGEGAYSGRKAPRPVIRGGRPDPTPREIRSAMSLYIAGAFVLPLILGAGYLAASLVSRRG